MHQLLNFEFLYIKFEEDFLKFAFFQTILNNLRSFYNFWDLNVVTNLKIKYSFTWKIKAVENLSIKFWTQCIILKESFKFDHQCFKDLFKIYNDSNLKKK